MKFKVGQKVKRNPVHFKSAATTPTWVGTVIEINRRGYRVRRPNDSTAYVYTEVELIASK